MNESIKSSQNGSPAVRKNFIQLAGTEKEERRGLETNSTGFVARLLDFREKLKSYNSKQY